VVKVWEGARNMNLKRLAVAAGIAAGILGLTSGAGLAEAAPLGPPPDCPTCQQDADGAWGIPAAKCWAYGRVGPGSPLGGGGVPGYLPQCKAAAPPPH
jgi:hypothetical protein